MDDGGPALFRLVRFWSRRWARGVAAEIDAHSETPQLVLVVDAVDSLGRGGVEPTVGDVAQQLGLDRSGASRMVASAVDRGHLERRRASSDARRSELALTSSGRDLLDDSRRWQQAKFLELTADWNPGDRRRLAGYLDRLAREVGA